MKKLFGKLLVVSLIAPLLLNGQISNQKKSEPKDEIIELIKEITKNNDRIKDLGGKPPTPVIIEEGFPKIDEVIKKDFNDLLSSLYGGYLNLSDILTDALYREVELCVRGGKDISVCLADDVLPVIARREFIKSMTEFRDSLKNGADDTKKAIDIINGKVSAKESLEWERNVAHRRIFRRLAEEKFRKMSREKFNEEVGPILSRLEFFESVLRKGSENVSGELVIYNNPRLIIDKNRLATDLVRWHTALVKNREYIYQTYILAVKFADPAGKKEALDFAFSTIWTLTSAANQIASFYNKDYEMSLVIIGEYKDKGLLPPVVMAIDPKLPQKLPLISINNDPSIKNFLLNKKKILEDIIGIKKRLTKCFYKIEETKDGFLIKVTFISSGKSTSFLIPYESIFDEVEIDRIIKAKFPNL